MRASGEEKTDIDMLIHRFCARKSQRFTTGDIWVGKNSPPGTKTVRKAARQDGWIRNTAQTRAVIRPQAGYLSPYTKRMV